MSVQVEESHQTAFQQISRASLLAAGWPALLAVVVSGITLGFFAWFMLLVPMQSTALSQGGLLLGLVGGPVLTLWAWFAYSNYFARRAGVRLQRSLQYDALTWSPFILLWLTFVLPLEYTHGARLLVVCTGLFAIAKLIIAARFNQTVRDVLIDFVLTRVAIIVIAELAAIIIGQRAGTHVQESRHLLLNVWGRWDAVHYLEIATVGYHGTDMAFFPLYPMLLAIVGNLIGNHLIAGLLISNTAFFFGLLYLYKLVEHEFDRHVARRAIFYISIFPTSIFFSAVYTESLFFMLTVASFYYMRAHRWWIAGFIGLFAAMTRVEGVLLMVPFAIEWYMSYRGRLSEGWRSLLPVVLIPLGMIAYMGYLWVLNGDPLYFSHVQSHWNRQLAAPWTALINSFHKITHGNNAQSIAGQWLELGFTALMIAVLIAGWKRLKPSYIAYMALSILVPMSTSSLMSMPRFALVLFPMFAIFALWGNRPAFNNAIVALSLPLLGLFTVLFT
ncbi:MAG: hypothetical protein JO165_13100, partial [Candidatus Eremiobacteraeota bacterium]|nr:hypothetical protein [Candidatus Eremiobacteraeota bacterium]